MIMSGNTVGPAAPTPEPSRIQIERVFNGYLVTVVDSYITRRWVFRTIEDVLKFVEDWFEG